MISLGGSIVYYLDGNRFVLTDHTVLDDEYLMHYGIKGMRWGFRRTPEQLARAAGRLTKKKTRDLNLRLKRVETRQ